MTMGIILDNPLKARENTNVINQLLTNKESPVFIHGNIYTSGTIFIPDFCTLFGEGFLAQIKPLDKSAPVIKLGKKASLKNIYIDLPTDFQSAAIVIEGNETHLIEDLEIHNVYIRGKYPYRTGTDTSVGLRMDGNGGSVYYSKVRGLTIFECYKGIEIGFLANGNTLDGVALQNCAHNIEVNGGGGNTINFTIQTGQYTLSHIICDGKINVFDGIIYDFGMYGSQAKLAYTFTGHSEKNIVHDRNGDLERTGKIQDYGLENRIINGVGELLLPKGHQEASGYNPHTKYPNYTPPSFVGIQDNALSFADKWATVVVKGTVIANSISTMFDHSNSYVVFDNPTINPIVIEITFNMPLPRVQIVGLSFASGRTAKSIKIEFKPGLNSSYQTLYENTENARTTLWNRTSNSGSAVYALKYTISEAISDINLNPDGKIAISYLFCNSDKGATWLPLNGGTIYGNLNITGLLTLGGKMNTLPVAQSSYRGQVVRIEGGPGIADGAYICRKKADDNYEWVNITP